MGAQITEGAFSSGERGPVSKETPGVERAPSAAAAAESAGQHGGSGLNLNAPAG